MRFFVCPLRVESPFLQVLWKPVIQPHEYSKLHFVHCPPSRYGISLSWLHPSYHLVVVSCLSFDVGYPFLVDLSCFIVSGCSAVSCDVGVFLRSGWACILQLHHLEHSCLTVVLICISLMTYCFGHLFTCLLSIYISLVKYLLKCLTSVLNQVVYFIITKLFELFVYLKIEYFIRCDFGKNFFPIYGLFSHSLDIVFCRS